MPNKLGKKRKHLWKGRFHMWVANEKLSQEANEVLLFTFQVFEKKQELTMVIKAWNMEKETLKTLSTIE